MRIKLSLLILTGLMATHAFARTADSDDSSDQPSKKSQNQKKKKKPETKKEKEKAAAHRKSVGELLRQADRGGAITLAPKKSISLPTFSAPVAPAVKHSAAVDLQQVKPPRTSFFYEDGTDDKSKLERITDQQISELYKLTQKFKDSSRRGELWLRLAELYVEKAGIIDFRKQNEYDTLIKDYLEGKSKVKPHLDLTDAHEFNRRAIQLYEWFVRDYPNDEKMDQALFFLGYNYFELNETSKGLVYYTRLTKDFPNSAFIIESHFALAEFYFENEKWQLAADHYQEVIKHRRHRLYGFSTYKQAWCFYRSGKTHQALLSLERLIRENRDSASQALAEGKKMSKARLEKESLRDLVLFYADDASYEKAAEYFHQMAGDDYLSYLEKLAYLYVDKGNRDGARTLFNFLISKDPTNSKAFDYKYQVIQAYASATKTREFREELYSWVKDFGPNSRWQQANIKNKDLIESSTKLRETTLKNWILTQHQTAQNSHAKFSQSLAYEGYKIFFQEFPNSTATADMHFFFAELLYDMERYEEAGIHYRWVVDNAPNSKFSTKAGENIVLALERDIPKDEDISAKVGKSLEPVAFDPRVQKFIEAAQWYLAKFPNSEKTAEIKFRVGRLYYQHNQFDKATPYFRDIIQNHPKTKYADYSANLLLDVYNLKKDYAGLEKAGQDLLAIPAVSSSAAGGDIRGVLEKAQFKKAQDLELNKDYAGAADQYQIFAKQNSSSPLIAAAYFNSGIDNERAGQNQKAMNDHIMVLGLKSKESEPLKPKSRRLLAKLYQDAGMLEEAAKTYRAAAVEAGNDPIAPNLYYDAALLDEALGHNEEAIQNLQAYFDKSKKAERNDAVFQMAEIQRRSGQSGFARYKEYFNFDLNNEKSVEAAYRVYEHYKQEKDQHETEVWSRKVLKSQHQLNANKKGPGAQWAAKVELDDCATFFGEMRHIQIAGEPGKQKRAAQKKVEMLSTLNQKLAAVLKYDSPEEIIGVLNLAGRANQHLAEALVNAPAPDGLKADELKSYQEAVQKLADPFLSKAKESFKTAVNRGFELESYGKEFMYAHEFLLKLDPGAIQDRGEQVMEQRSSSWMMQ